MSLESMLSQNAITALSRVNRRYYIVGEFSTDPDLANKLYYFGPSDRREKLINAIAGDRRFKFPKSNTFTDFLDEVKPVVTETLAESNASIVIAVGASSETKGIKHDINSYLPLYDGRSPLKGKDLLEQLSKDVDLYLDYTSDKDSLRDAFNEYFYNHQHRQDPQKVRQGVAFHSNFVEVLKQFLILETRVNFDSNSLKWNGKWENWTEDGKKRFGKTIENFRDLLLDPNTNELDRRYPHLRVNFQKQRDAIIRTSKTTRSHFMLSQLAYWVIYTLIGEKLHGEVNEPEHDPLFAAINGTTDDSRKWKLRAGQEITLAEPIRSLGDRDNRELRKGILGFIDDYIQIYLEDQIDQDKKYDKLRKDFKDSYSLSPDEISNLEKQLDVARRFFIDLREKLQSKVKFNDAVNNIKRSFLRLVETYYVKALVGQPSVQKSQIQGIYKNSLLELYLEAVLIKGGVVEELRNNARNNGRSIISDLVSVEDTDERESRLRKNKVLLAAPALEIAFKSFPVNFADSYDALEVYSEWRSHSIENCRAFNAMLPDQKQAHSGKSEGDIDLSSVLTPIRAELITDDVERGRERSNQDNKDAGIAINGQENLSNSTEITSDSKNSFNETEESDTAINLFNLVSKFALKVEQSSDGIDCNLGINEFVKLVKVGVELTYEARDSSEEFKNVFRQHGLAEIMLANSSKLEFGKNLSSMYKLVLDLIRYGSEGIEKFLQEYSLTEYFSLADSDALQDLYQRLGKQTEDGLKSMAQFISEIRGIEYLFGRIKPQLDKDCELLIFNGSADEFLKWLGEQFGNKQYWSHANIQEERFIFPSLIYILESALDGISNQSNAEGNKRDVFLKNLKNYAPTGTRTKAQLPIITFGSSHTFKEYPKDTTWYSKKNYSNKWMYDHKLQEEFPCPIYVVGPAANLKNSDILSLPSGFLMIEMLIAKDKVSNNSYLDNNIADEVDFVSEENIIPSQVFSLSRSPLTIQDQLEKLFVYGSNDQKLIPFEAALWTNTISLIYNYFITMDNMDKEIEIRNELKSKFKHIPNIDKSSLNDRIKDREPYRECFHKLGGLGDFNRYSLNLDFETIETIENTKLFVVNKKSYDEYSLNIPWFVKSFGKN